MKKRYIYFWHPPDKELVKKISSFCKLEMVEGMTIKKYCYIGTLDDFETLYGSAFIVMGKLICVTPHSSFGQR